MNIICIDSFLYHNVILYHFLHEETTKINSKMSWLQSHIINSDHNVIVV